MGMYTELSVRFMLKKDVPELVVYAIQAMTEGRSVPVEHSDKINGRMEWMFRSGSFYHHPVAAVSFEKLDGEGPWSLTVRFDIKNYEGEIERFIEWVTPFIDASDGEFLGYQRYEEDDYPTMLRHPNEWVSLKEA